MADIALVLGAGGVTGSAWETGILYGLAEAGVDLSTAGLIIGSSAGAVVGAQLASGLLGLPELYARQLAIRRARPAAGSARPRSCATPGLC
ncbi:hypothetical protein [Streptomyces sp. NBC_01602]|uniref:hypothetical protein n=1 Tax=Streptomyces sp. NBC_01602 TaxID=2975893 RepID=UPI00386CFA5A